MGAIIIPNTGELHVNVFAHTRNSLGFFSLSNSFTDYRKSPQFRSLRLLFLISDFNIFHVAIRVNDLLTTSLPIDQVMLLVLLMISPGHLS